MDDGADKVGGDKDGDAEQPERSLVLWAAAEGRQGGIEDVALALDGQTERLYAARDEPDADAQHDVRHSGSV